MRCKWLHNLVKNLGTVKAFIRKPNEFTLCEIRTELTLDELVESLKDTGCTVEIYDGKLVEKEQ